MQTIDRYTSAEIEKHLPGRHDQHTHNKKRAQDVPSKINKPAVTSLSSNKQYKFSEETKPVPRQRHAQLVKEILESMGAMDVKVSLIYSADDPAYRKLFEENTKRGEPLPEFVPGKGPMLDFGGGEKGVSYAVYDDVYGTVNIFDDAFSISEADAAKCLAHEVNHSIFERAVKKNKSLANIVKSEDSVTGAVLAKTDGVTSYSRHHWNMYLAGKKGNGVKNWTGETLDMETAVAETLAEMAKVYVSDRSKFNTFHPVWKKLYVQVNKSGGGKKWTDLTRKPQK